MCRDDLLRGLEAQQRGDCPHDEEHRTVEKHGELHCNDCERTFYS